MQMIARNYQPALVECESQDKNNVECCATRSADGKTLVIQVVNYSEHPLPATLRLNGYSPSKATARITELSGSLHEMNTAFAPERVKSYSFDWPHNLGNGQTVYTLPPLSFSIIRFE
jgi:alpha-L-arabinofuranosidase